MAGTGKGVLRIAIEDFLNTFGFGKRIHDWMVAGIEELENAGITIYARTVNLFYPGVNIPAPFDPETMGGLIKSSQNGFWLWLVAMGGMILGGIFGFGQPSARVAMYSMDAQLRTHRPNPLDIVQMARRGAIDESLWIPIFQDLGVPDKIIRAYFELGKNYLPALEYERLRRRGIVSDADWSDKMTKLGYDASEFENIKALGELIPSPSDLISMAVREAWNDETVQRFDYDNGFDDIPQFQEWMTKQGLGGDWPKRYWRAHWQLPGIGQAYEMLHRLRSGETEFTIDDMETLLKTADIPAFFRKRLIEISYNPYTRVDVRRMFAAGVLDRDAVKGAYLDLGYDEEHAEKMTQFTTNIEKAEEKGLTKEALIGAYKRGIYTRDQTIEAIQAIGYNSTDADFWLDLADFDLQSSITDVQLSVIQARFVNGTIDESQLAGELGKLNMPSERTQALQELWAIQRNNKTNIPSRSELDDLLRRDIIDHDKYKASLKLDGFNSETIEYFTKRIDQIIADDAAAIASEKQIDDERLAGSTRASTYQKRRAEIEVQVAQIKSAIADLTLEIYNMTDEEKIKAARELVQEYKVAIVHLNEDKSNLKLDFLTPPTQ